jgi:hypothetical protein
MENPSDSPCSPSLLLAQPLGVTCVEEIRSENAIGTGSSLKEFCGKSAEL